MGVAFFHELQLHPIISAWPACFQVQRHAVMSTCGACGWAPFIGADAKNKNVLTPQEAAT